VLDDYGIFDEEYYRMVIGHFSQSEMQIVQWRSQVFAGNPTIITDQTALYPRNYINPHAWHAWNQTGKMSSDDADNIDLERSTLEPGHPLKDMHAWDFTDGSFSMAGWKGPCSELVLGKPPDVDNSALRKSKTV
jgi:hypothetical protein